MKYVILAAVFFALVGCKEAKAVEKISDAGDGHVEVVFDAKREVTCYIYDGYKEGGIFCFTKQQLESK